MLQKIETLRQFSKNIRTVTHINKPLKKGLQDPWNLVKILQDPWFFEKAFKPISLHMLP